ncbi:hypothetical protein PYS58_01970 [Chryseobacterium indologenes]|uniref:hypothetical protein n=1 Tax=Chryseobacterium indologenes TaxID=253 RepID=UPI0023E87FD6|nr:hypothetical protein [Chryseobacterium indologenes]WET49901.1 hypothetical protein PYS58_01970 [Chryseobacterium indologenes]
MAIIKRNIIINNPCSEHWEDMQDSSEGKFCEKCSKCIIDFTEKTDQEIKDVFALAKGKEICGKISPKSFSKIAAGIVLVTHLSFVQAQVENNFDTFVEQKASNIIRISGKLIFKRTKKEIGNAEVFFICRSRYIKTTTDNNGIFILEIPEELLQRKNVLHFNFDKLNDQTYKSIDRRPTNIMNGDIYENASIIFKKGERINDQEFQIDSQHSYIGGVTLMTEMPPDYYYFNGKNISKRKFEKLKDENPEYQFFFFTDKEGEAIAEKSYLNSLRLLYSD